MRYEVRNIEGGWNGTDDTVQTIYSLVDQSLQDPVVVREARSIVRNVPERDKNAESKAISDYVRNNVRYTSETVETLSTPRLMIDDIHEYGKATGDCDESVTLWMALHRILGFQVRARVISQRDDKQASHIFGQVFIKGRGWVSDDTIVKNKPRGWFPPMKYRTKTKDYGVRGLGSLDLESESSEEEPSRMSVNGPVRKIRSDDLTPPYRAMIGRSVASKGFQLKPSGGLYIDRAGSLSGIGVTPTLGINLSTLVNAVTDISVVKDAAGGLPISPKAAKAPAAKPSSSDSGGGMNLTTLLLIGVGGWFLFKKKK